MSFLTSTYYNTDIYTRPCRLYIMPLDIFGEFFRLIRPDIFYNSSIAFVASFLLYEIPQTLKLVNDEQLSKIYSPQGRLVDIALFIIGLIMMLFMLIGNNLEKIMNVMKMPGVMAIFLIVLVCLVILIVFSFLRNLVKKLEGGLSASAFIVQVIIDFLHKAFYLTLVLITVPVVGYFLVNFVK